MGQIDLINLIRNKDLGYLSNPELLEHELLLQLGLSDAGLEEFPEELYPFCGKGLLSWQYPNQFSKYLVKLSKYKIESYLEIGVKDGGTFIITVEYLNRFHELHNVVGVDICSSPACIIYEEFNPKARFLQIDSQSDQFRDYIAESPRFDLVLIDGLHEESSCRHDFETIKDKANIIVLHDMASDVCPGVVKVWQDIRAGYSDVYNFYTYTDQYGSVGDRTGKSYLGIGMAVRKDWR